MSLLRRFTEIIVKTRNPGKASPLSRTEERPSSWWVWLCPNLMCNTIQQVQSLHKPTHCSGLIACLEPPSDKKSVVRVEIVERFGMGINIFGSYQFGKIREKFYIIRCNEPIPNEIFQYLSEPHSLDQEDLDFAAKRLYEMFCVPWEDYGVLNDDIEIYFRRSCFMNYDQNKVWLGEGDLVIMSSSSAGRNICPECAISPIQADKDWKAIMDNSTTVEDAKRNLHWLRGTHKATYLLMMVDGELQEVALWVDCSEHNHYEYPGVIMLEDIMDFLEGGKEAENPQFPVRPVRFNAKLVPLVVATVQRTRNEKPAG